MKTVTAVTLLLIALLCPTAQSQSPKHLSDAFAKSGLRALKAIEGDGSMVEIREGEAYGNRHTLDAINEADSDAKTKAESALVTVLNRLYLEKLVNNSQRDMRETTITLEDHTNNEIIKKINVSEALSRDPEMKRIRAKEQACFTVLEESFRARSTVIPKTCDSIAIQAATNP